MRLRRIALIGSGRPGIAYRNAAIWASPLRVRDRPAPSTVNHECGDGNCVGVDGIELWWRPVHTNPGKQSDQLKSSRATADWSDDGPPSPAPGEGTVADRPMRRGVVAKG